MPDDTRQLIPFGLGSTTGELADAAEIVVDNSGFSSVTATNSQETASELERLFNIVAGTQPGTPAPGLSGPFIPFANSVNVDTAGVSTYAGNIALYARSDNARVNFILPTDAEITAAGVATDEQVEITVLNQAGTGRFDTGFEPTNTVIIDVEGANNIRRNTETGTLLNFIEAHQNDLVTLTQAERGRPWVAVRVTLSNAALLLPSGLFRLQVGVRASLNPALGFIAGLPSGVTPQAGDAYEVSVGNDNFGGYGVQSGDVIVALQDNPSRVISATNDDWLVIRNATNDIITLSEIFFLNTVTESDAFEDDRLIDRSDVNDVNVFLANGILDHAPFLTPSTDSDNPQSSNGAYYVGGNEDVSAGNEFHLTDFTKLGEPAGSTRAPNLQVYFDVDGSVMQPEVLANTFLVLKDGQGEEVSRFNGATQFRAITFPDNSDTYYVLDLVGASDNYSSINYLAGYTIEVVERRTLRSFTLSDAVNALNALADGSIPIEKLQPNVQALITADHSLTDEQETILDGFQTTSTPTPWTAGDLYVRDTNASPTSDLGHYFNVGQQNGILSNHDHTRAVTFVVPNFVTVTQLQRTDDTSIKHPVTRIGAITVQDNTVNPPRTFNGQGFTATLPASTFDINNPIGDIWQVDGTASNRELTGADNSFKVGLNNLRQEVVDRFTPHADPLPDNLQSLSHDLTLNHATLGVWREVNTGVSSQVELTRQFAALWDENRRSFGTDNYFDDLTGIQTLGYGQNNVFFYSDPNAQENTSFPGAQSYILDDNIRFRNQPLEDTISDSFRKVIAFDYALDAPLSDSDNADMLRIGPSGTTALMGLSQNEGLYLNIGRGDGGQRSRDIVTPLERISGGIGEYPFGTFSGLPTSGEGEFLAPNPNLDGTSYPVTIRIKVRLDDDGNDEGTFVQDYVITNINTDQAETQFTATHTINGSPRSFTWAVRYDANHNHATFGQQNVIFIRDVNPETNPALTDYVSMEYTRTVTWNAPATYAREPINAGSGHDDFGLFDPTRYNTEHVHERNRVILLVRPYSLFDTSSDPELAVQVIVDGEKEGSSDNGYVIRLHRPASEFTFDDISFGNNLCAVSHIQCYDYDAGHLIGEDGLLDFYNAADRWLGRFRHPTDTIDDFVVDANWELTQDKAFILRDTATNNRYSIEIENGTIKTTQVT